MTTPESSMREKLDLLFARRSIRVYKDGNIDEATMHLIMEAAMAAPSAVSRDPWRFVVIRERETLQKLAEVLPNGQMIGNATVGIVVCGDISSTHDNEISFLLQDTAVATQNILLACQALGLGACWLSIHPRTERVDAVSRLLDLPGNILPIAGVSIGHPGEEKEPRTRFNPAWLHHERW